MQGVSRRVAMLFVMTTDDLDRKDTAFQRNAQLFRLFSCLLTEKHSILTEGREDKKWREPSISVQKNCFFYFYLY